MTAVKKPLTIAGKLAAAVSDVDRIGKDGTNSFHKYTYTSAEQVYRVVRGPLLEQGLVVVPSVAESETTSMDSGKGLVSTTVMKLHLRILDTETGESIEAYWMGEGQDKGDKGPYKAATGAMKTWLKHLFLLPADDDPEADPSTDQEASQPTLKDRLVAAADRLEVSAENRKVIAGWFMPDGEVSLPRLEKAVERLENNDAAGLLALTAEDVEPAVEA